jgi:hypothetical protein
MGLYNSSCLEKLCKLLHFIAENCQRLGNGQFKMRVSLVSTASPQIQPNRNTSKVLLLS